MWNVHASGKTKADVLTTVAEQLKGSPDDEAAMVLAFIKAKVDDLPTPNENQSIDVYSSGSAIVASAELREVKTGLVAKEAEAVVKPKTEAGKPAPAAS